MPGLYSITIAVFLCIVGIAQGVSICDKYSQLTSNTNLALVTSIVGGTFTALAGNATTRPYFNGVRPLGSTDFTTNTAAATTLSGGLVRFFGGALGCTDGTIAPYTGAALDAIHLNMGVTTLAFDTFNELLLKVTAGAGVTAQDNAAILGVLQSTKPAVVFPLSICDKYSEALAINNFALVKTVVEATELKLLGNSTTLPFFNGVSPPGSTDFSAPGNAARLSALTASLINFFGAALGCRDGSVPAYTGGTMQAVHATMGVTPLVFDTFNQLLLQVTAGAGVSPADNDAILSVLETTRGAIVTVGAPTNPVPTQPGPGPRVPNNYDATFKVPNKTYEPAIIAAIVIAVIGALAIGLGFAYFVFFISGGNQAGGPGYDDYAKL